MGLASRGQRDMDTGPSAIEDLQELTTVRAQARTVRRRALMWAAALTVLAVLVP